MLLQTISEIFYFIKMAMDGLMSFLVFILLIVVAVNNIKKELGPDCKKGFSRFFIAFLFFLMFSPFIDFAYLLTFRIIVSLRDAGEIDYVIFLQILLTSLSVNRWLRFLNKWIAFILLFVSMEIYLFNKKSKWKFGILALVLLFGSLLLFIIDYFIPNLLGLIGVLISSLIFELLINFNYIIIGIIILILLRKTAKENDSLLEYTKSLSIGVILLLIVIPLFNQLIEISYFVDRMLKLDGNLVFDELNDWIYRGLYLLSSLLFIIGIIILTVGAVKTMSVPLTFAKGKKAKVIARKVPNSCPDCGAPIPIGVQFCTNCGHKL
ncbi:MAG: zinc ribbon domain-containing protein [Promethearchaeota archaeon]